MEDKCMSKVKVKKDKEVSVDKKDILNTTINSYVLNEFRRHCRKVGIPMNTLLETFMKQFSNDEFDLRFGRSKSKVDFTVDNEGLDTSNIFDD